MISEVTSESGDLGITVWCKSNRPSDPPTCFDIAPPLSNGRIAFHSKNCTIELKTQNILPDERQTEWPCCAVRGMIGPIADGHDQSAGMSYPPFKWRIAITRSRQSITMPKEIRIIE
jgi:hypothetical protein